MQFSEILKKWYVNHKRDLPWRNTTNPYKIWLSEIILQQTQVVQGLPYYNTFVKQYPTVFALANASEEQILKSWQGLGYYSRARNLHATAKYVANELNGFFPGNYKDLLMLKGVGDYTASAIASICFNENTAVVDGNVYRVLSRYFGIETPINTPKGTKAFKALAQELIDKNDPATFNQAIMEFGAKQCSPKSPDCGVCPLQQSCVAFNKKTIEQLPVKIKGAKVKNKYFNFLVIIGNQNTVVVEKRLGKGIWENLYQFPLIETKKGITYKEMLSHTKQHPLLKGKTFTISLYNETDVVHKLSHQHLHTKFWIANTSEQVDTAIPIADIRNYAVPALISNFIDQFNF